MMATSAKRRRLWVSVAAPCTGACKNTDWNDAFKLRTQHPTAGPRRGVSRFAHRAHPALDRRLFVRHRLDTHAGNRLAVAGVRRVASPARRLLLANALQPSSRHARRGFFFAWTRR